MSPSRPFGSSARQESSARPPFLTAGQHFLYRAFVEYNPLYFASALCVLAGLFLLSGSLRPGAMETNFWIVGSTEAYEFLLIGGAALLLGAGARRPAALLGLLALAFILDLPMNSERLLSQVGLLSLAPGMRARRVVPFSVAVALLGPPKLWLLGMIFRLRAGKGGLWVAAAAALLLPLLPYVTELVDPFRRQSVYLVTCWLGAPILAWACTPGARNWTCGRTAEPQDPRLGRMGSVIPFLLAATFLLHRLVWCSVATLPATPALVSPYLLLASWWGMRRRGPGQPARSPALACVGILACFGTAYSAESSVGSWALAAMLVAAGCGFAWFTEIEKQKLFLPAAGCVSLGAYLWGMSDLFGGNIPAVVWTAALALGLLAGTVRYRQFSSLLASALTMWATLGALHRIRDDPSFAVLLAGGYLAVTSWILFPALRKWVGTATLGGILFVGAWMIWRGIPGTPWVYGTLALAAIGAGWALGKIDLLAAGLAGAAALGSLKANSLRPGSPAGWGFLLLAAGFVLLSVGVAINLWISRRAARLSQPSS